MSNAQDSLRVEDRIADLSAKLGVHIPEIYLPSDISSIGNWPVIACDQYTSSPSYWEEVRQRVEDAGTPSAYNIVLPEIYLEDPGEIPVNERIAQINRTMRDYFSNEVITSRGRCMVFVDRATPETPSRKGLVFAIDLEKYDYRESAGALIRATEGTVTERIPPRLLIRKDAGLEIPHVMLLADDPDDSIIGPISGSRDKFECLYDTELPEGGGHIRGWRIPSDSEAVLGALRAMSALRSYTVNGLLFAVGDGNHSLAAAKTHWDKIKDSCSDDHPARYALAELVNIYDKGLTFEPIHRILFGADHEDLTAFARNRLPAGSGIETSDGMSLENAALMASKIDPSVQPFIIVGKGHATVVTCNAPPSAFTAGTAQFLIDSYLSAHPAARVDYIHGDDQIMKLSDKDTGIMLPAIYKEDFFSIISAHGTLPRKTFSMGEADEKRFYMECRMII